MEVNVFRLIKWTAYVLIGYMIYEFFQGMCSGRGTGARRRAQSAADAERTVVRGVGSMTGPRKGKRVQTESPDGAAVTHVVGRGVV
jgi:hypothetical protein